MKLKKWFLVLLIVSSFGVFCESGSAVTNEQIASQALKHTDGEVVGQCKIFVQSVFSELNIALGSGYRDCYLQIGTEIIGYNNVRRGDIIQTSNNDVPGNTDHVHSAIVLENRGNGYFYVIHSNWDLYGEEDVSRNIINPALWISKWEGWSVHYYRLGTLIPTNFTFPLGSSEGMKPNWSMIEKPLIGVDEWRVQVSNDDPGVDSPEYPSGLVAKSIVIEFSAKVISGGNPVSEGKVYIKDETGSWINSVPLTLINSEFNYNGGQFALNEYNVFRANLNYAARPEAQMRQFSIQLTDGLSMSETWTFDWIKVKVTGWDFKDNQTGWEIRQNGQTADFYAGEYWRISPTGKQPQIVSPDNLMIGDFYTKVGIRYSVSNTTGETARVYFDVGSGFSSTCMEAVSIPHNGSQVSAIFNIPACAKGTTKRIMFDLFDNDNYLNKLIAINNIAFTVEENDPVVYEVPIVSQLLSSNSGDAVYPPENLQATAKTENSISISWSQGLNTNIETVYNIYRDGNLIRSQAATSYTDYGLSLNTEYNYHITASLNGTESSPSANLIVRTNEAQVSVPEVLIIDSAVTKELINNIPAYELYSYQYGAYPNEIYAWALVEIYNINIEDLDWWFTNAQDGYISAGETTRIPVGGNRFFIYRKAYMGVACSDAYGTWGAKLMANSVQKVHSVTFTMSIRNLSFAAVDEDAVTSDSAPVRWGKISCATHYVVYRSGQYLGEADSEQYGYIDSTVVPGARYIYQVVAKYEDSEMTLLSEPKTTQEVIIPLKRISAPNGFGLEIR